MAKRLYRAFVDDVDPYAIDDTGMVDVWPVPNEPNVVELLSPSREDLERFLIDVFDMAPNEAAAMIEEIEARWPRPPRRG